MKKGATTISNSFAAFIIVSMLAIPVAVKSEEMTYNLVQGLNGISLPYEETGINDAEESDPDDA